MNYTMFETRSLDELLLLHKTQSEEIQKELARRAEEKKAKAGARMLELPPRDSDGDRPSYGVKYGILSLWSESAKNCGYDPERLAREIALAPCMADLWSRDDTASDNYHYLRLWIRAKLHCCAPSEKQNEVARNAGWIS